MKGNTITTNKTETLEVELITHLADEWISKHMEEFMEKWGKSGWKTVELTKYSLNTFENVNM